MRGIDGNVGNVRRKTVRLFQIMSFILFMALLANMCQPTWNINILSSQNILENRPSQINIEENISIVKIGEPIVVTKNNHETNKKKYAFTIVTGVSKNHFCPIKGFVYNLKNTLKGLNARIVIYDLGLTDVQQEEIKNLGDNGYFDELRVFNYSAYPSFWDISKNRGEYAWKPGVVEEVSNEYPGIIVWLDSGTLPERRYFEKLPYLLKKYNGFLSPRSSGFMNTWTHPGVYDYYGDDASKYEDFPNCNGAAVAFDTKKTRHIIKSWYLCALDKDCIAPSGSNRTNHRQDQSILTYLISRERGRSCSIRKSKIWIHTHEDSNCRKIITFYEKLNNINNSY